MLLLVSSIKLVAEIALMALIGQWLVGLMAGQRREQNVFYRARIPGAERDAVVDADELYCET